MSHFTLSLGVLFLLTLYSGVVIGEDDEEVKGPIMLKNTDGSLMTTKQQIDARKYKGETHSVVTGDGYVLTAFRVIPTTQPASVVVLQHGYLCSSDVWVTDPDALAFKLSDAGYDVWINNIRGNFYSRNHTKLNPDKDKDFWNFSFHEMATKDMPAVVDYIIKTTGQPKVHYVGHSLGTTISYIMTSLKPEYNNKLKSLVSLSPVAFLSKMTEMVGPDGMVEEMANKYMDQFKSSDKWEVFPRKDVPPNNVTQITCDDVEENFQDMCRGKVEMAQDVLGGAYIPAGQSFKTMSHFYQLSASGALKYFRYETPEKNEKMYGSKEPPSYTDNFKNITVPTVLWSSEFDGVVMAKDVDDLKPLLGNVIADNRIPDECFDHVTFLFPRLTACVPLRQKLYKDLIEAIKKLD